MFFGINSLKMWMMNKAILQCKTNIYKIKAYAQNEEIYINNDTNQTIKHNNQTKTKLSPQGP